MDTNGNSESDGDECPNIRRVTGPAFPADGLGGIPFTTSMPGIRGGMTEMPRRLPDGACTALMNHRKHGHGHGHGHGPGLQPDESSDTGVSWGPPAPMEAEAEHEYMGEAGSGGGITSGMSDSEPYMMPGG